MTTVHFWRITEVSPLRYSLLTEVVVTGELLPNQSDFSGSEYYSISLRVPAVDATLLT